MDIVRRDKSIASSKIVVRFCFCGDKAAARGGGVAPDLMGEHSKNRSFFILVFYATVAAAASMSHFPRPLSLNNDSDTETQFLLSGWCSHQVRRLHSLYSPDALRYLSRLDRQGYRANSHEPCAHETRCIANNVDMRRYNSAHTPSCSGNCAPIDVDYEAVVEIIRAGGVPIVSIHAATEPEVTELHLSLHVIPRAISTRYTVLSHVWFDGLGNPSANALPTCQVRRLYTQLKSMPGDYESGKFDIGSLEVDWTRQHFVRQPALHPPLFWMDTLCIPVHDNHKDLRGKAINQMASIYAAAVQELVLDAELLQCDTNSCSALEILARITCSAWMTRSWTLQEGVLARECVFQFLDRAVDPIHEWCLHGVRPRVTETTLLATFPATDDEQEWGVYRELYNILWDTLHQDWKSSYRRDPPTPAAYWSSGGTRSVTSKFAGSQAAGKVHTLPAVQGLSKRDENGLDENDHFTMELREDHRLKQLVDTWNELAHRSTTMPDDLHVIIANLLDFNADRIMSISTREDRMKAMILSFDLLPVSLFWNDGPKFRDSLSFDTSDNNRWIPVQPSKTELTLSPVMQVTPGWLDVNIGPVAGMRNAEAFILHDNPAGAGQASFLCAGLCSSLDLQRVSLLGLRTNEILTPTFLSHAQYLVIEAASAASGHDSRKGALFARIPPSNAEDSTIIRLTYYCPVTVEACLHQSSDEMRYARAEALSSTTRLTVKYGMLISSTCA
jgi:hypothetical protein